MTVTNIIQEIVYGQTEISCIVCILSKENVLHVGSVYMLQCKRILGMYTHTHTHPQAHTLPLTPCPESFKAYLQLEAHFKNDI